MERAYPSFSSRRANYSTLHIPCSKIHISNKFYLFLSLAQGYPCEKYEISRRDSRGRIF
jgi:hypothetical protein